MAAQVEVADPGGAVELAGAQHLGAEAVRGAEADEGRERGRQLLVRRGHERPVGIERVDDGSGLQVERERPRALPLHVRDGERLREPAREGPPVEAEQRLRARLGADQHERPLPDRSAVRARGDALDRAERSDDRRRQRRDQGSRTTHAAIVPGLARNVKKMGPRPGEDRPCGPCSPFRKRGYWPDGLTGSPRAARGDRDAAARAAPERGGGRRPARADADRRLRAGARARGRPAATRAEDHGRGPRPRRGQGAGRRRRALDPLRPARRDRRGREEAARQARLAAAARPTPPASRRGSLRIGRAAAAAAAPARAGVLTRATSRRHGRRHARLPGPAGDVSAHRAARRSRCARRRPPPGSGSRSGASSGCSRCGS